MCFVPGISVYLFSVAYITKNYWYSVLLVYPASLVSAILSYLLAKYTVKNWLNKKLHDKWFYRIYYDESKLKPWETSIILRILLIPVNYKNYLIAIMDINFM